MRGEGDGFESVEAGHELRLDDLREHGRSVWHHDRVFLSNNNTSTPNTTGARGDSDVKSTSSRCACAWRNVEMAPSPMSSVSKTSVTRMLARCSMSQPERQHEQQQYAALERSLPLSDIKRDIIDQ